MINKNYILNVVSQLTDKFDNLLQDVGTIKDFLEEEKISLKSDNSALQENIKSLESEKTSLNSEKSDLQKKLETLESEKTSLESEKSALQESIKSLESEKTSLESAKSDLQKKFESLESEKTSLESVKSDLQKKCESLESEKSTLQEENAVLKTKTENFKSGAEIYTDLLKAIYKCPSMKEYVSEKGLPDTIAEVDEQAVIRFISLAGGRNIFAVDMLNCINKYKRENPQPMTNEEKNLMDSANIFYKKKDNIPDKDLLFIPDGMENPAECKVIFRKSEMKDIRTVLGNFKTAVTLYSPGLRDINNNTISIKATVEGK